MKSSSLNIIANLGGLLALCAAMALSPTTYDYLLLSFTSVRLPIGTFAFTVFIGLSILMIVTGQINRQGVLSIIMLLGVSFGLALTSLWSPSQFYLQFKLPLVMSTPALLFGAGYCLAASGHLRTFAYSICALSLLILVGIWAFGIDVVVGFQTGLEEEFGGRYQSISRVLAVGAVMFVALSMSARIFLHRVALFSAGAILLFQVLFTGGRVGLLIILIAMPLLYLCIIGPRWRLASIIIFMLAALLFISEVDLASLAIAIWPGELPLTVQRILIDYSTESIGSFQLLDRDNLWRLALELFKENPLFGVGLAGYPVSAGIGDTLGVYPHNIILELASETGLYGLTLFSGFASIIMFSRSHGPVDPADRLVAIGILASGVAISSVISDFGLQRELFLGLGLHYGLKFVNIEIKNAKLTPIER